MNNNEALFYEQEKYFWSAICCNTVNIDDQTIAYFTKLMTPEFNFIYLHQGASVDSFKSAESLFKEQRKSYILVVHNAELEKFQPYISQRNLINDGESTAMVLNHADLIKQTKYSVPENYHIQQCNKQLISWAQPLITAFPSAKEDGEIDDDTVINEYIRYHQRALDKNINMMHFVLFHEQNAVSALTLTINGQVARLDDIGTDVRYQKKGLATILIKFALQFCQQHGIEQCVLEASSDGLSIYRKLGFQPIFNYTSFIAE
ncbi:MULTISPECIES: GNAT family N-acetyltransferase [Providencia]|nr:MULTISPECIES: GNAT family N-acetyltransferase [Providencia]MBP6121351.1 GNAT family N-acetyltransferase [Providencia sp.]NIH22760.1 GNAT family N-acetyltransferase [Providencia heimbachae]